MKEIKSSTRIIRFIIIGTLNALITAVVIGIMMHSFKCNYIISNVVAYILAQINNFFWCKYWIFTAPHGSFTREIPLFLIAFACAYGAQFLFILLLVEKMHMDAYLAQFLGLFVYGLINFIMNKRITFLVGSKKNQKS